MTLIPYKKLKVSTYKISICYVVDVSYIALYSKNNSVLLQFNQYEINTKQNNNKIR